MSLLLKQQYPQREAEFVPYFITALSAPGSTSSAGPVDYPGPIVKDFYKRKPTTGLLISGHGSAYKGGETGNIFLYLGIAGADWPIGRFFFNDLSSHREISFERPIGWTLPPGPYTARLRWSTDAGSVHVDANDPVDIRIQEGYFL